MKTLRYLLLSFLLVGTASGATQLLAPGTTAVDSSDITAPFALVITPASGNNPMPSGVIFYLQYKNAAGSYNTVATLNSTNINSVGLVLTGGTYRVERPLSTVSAGIDYSVPVGSGGAVTCALCALASLQPTNTAAESTSSGQTGTIGFGYVTTSAPTYTTAKSDPLSLDTAGNLRTVLPPFAPGESASAEACHVIKNAAGTLYNVSGYAGQSEWIMLFNATSAPGDGAVTPVWWGYAGTAGAWDKTFLFPLTMGTGITICYSSTGPFTKTALSTNNAFSWESN